MQLHAFQAHVWREPHHLQLNNGSGVAGPDAMGGQMGQPGGQAGSQMGQPGGQMGQASGQAGSQMGQPGGQMGQPGMMR